MIKKTGLILEMILLFIILIGFISAANVCCEKTKTGIWCQNLNESQCSSDFRKSETSCEATSFCKMGTCVNVNTGTCTENTPESVCNEAKGIWKDKSADEISECQLGCCLIGNQAAFVTQTKCKRLSASFGLETIFRTDIHDEVTCIANARSIEEGACVFESEFEKTCKRTTKEECKALEKSPKSPAILKLFDATPDSIESITFYPGRLCSDANLSTNCGQSQKTICVEGKDEVYFVDTCGNIANIYDYSKINNQEYWAVIKTKSESCNSGKSNADSKTCGNCDYYAGSTCKVYKASQDKNPPSAGNNICRDLSCTWKGKTYQHGETWCADSSGIDDSLPGSRAFRLVCYNGDVTIEPCADFRNELCIESDVNGFSTAICRLNLWQDCFEQTEEDCVNKEERDCQWINSGKKDEAGNDILGCSPQYAPGFNFWEKGDAQDICGLATQTVTVTYEKGINDYAFGSNWDCNDDDPANNCFAATGEKRNEWIEIKQKVCSSLGDCGAKINYLGVPGEYKDPFETK